MSLTKTVCQSVNFLSLLLLSVSSKQSQPSSGSASFTFKYKNPATLYLAEFRVSTLFKRAFLPQGQQQAQSDDQLITDQLKQQSMGLEKSLSA